MKLIKRIVLVVIVLIIVALIGLYVSLNSVVRATVAREGTASLNVPTTLNSATLEPFAGKVSLGDLEVGPIPNFSAPHIFSVNGLSVAVTYGQLFGNPIHINKIVIDNPQLVVEQSNLKLNIQALMDQPSQTPTSSSTSSSQPLKLIIDELDVNNAQVSFLPGLPGVLNPMNVAVPSVVLKNIGNADNSQNGAAIKDVVMQTITAVAGKAGSSGGLPPDLTKALSGGLGQVAQQLGQSFNSQFQDATGSLTQNLSKNLGGVGNVLGNSGKQLPDLNNLLNNNNDKKSGQ
jgi:hypothetical protein